MFDGKSRYYFSKPTLANTAAVITLQAKPGIRHWVTQVEWSYSKSPGTAGLLTIEHGTAGNVIKEYSITLDGPDYIAWDAPLNSDPGAMFRFTLAAGGNGNFGRLMVNELFPSIDQG